MIQSPVATKQDAPPWLRMVQALYSYDEQDVLTLQAKFMELYVQTAERAIRAELRALGCSDRGVKLTNQEMLAELGEDARTWAGSVARTYNRWLTGALNAVIETYRAAHNGTLRGMHRRTLAKLIRTPIRNYWRGKRKPQSAGGGWRQGKLNQIAITESTRASTRAFLRFKERSGLTDDLVRLMPFGAVCDVCQAAVRLGWITVAMAMEMVFPAHPNCPHSWQSKRDEGVVIDCAAMWRGE